MKWNESDLDKLLAEMERLVASKNYSEPDRDLISYWAYRLKECKC